MPDTAQGETTELRWMAKALHDLCQPLTALECRLVLGLMEADSSETSEEVLATLRLAVEEAQVQCARTMQKVREMQDRLTP